jgi:acetyl esterase/lipase
MQDWSDAYSSSPYIADAAAFPPRWAAQAEEWRRAAPNARLDQPYGDHPRHRFDLFLPAGRADGVVVFVHGGYWMSFDKSTWSHLAAGAVAQGWAFALPSYRLCPEVRISDITLEIGAAVSAIAAQVTGPLRLAGHSAGGHLVSRLCCEDGPLPTPLRARLAHTLSLSGLHDLRPLLATRLNQTLHLDEEEALRESPALLRPLPATSISCWVGADERPEFRRQNALLANIWTGLGAAAQAVEAPGLHHFTVIDGLAEPGSALLGDLLSRPS